MIEDRGTHKPVAAWPRYRWVVALALLVGTGASTAAEPPEPRLAGMIPSSSELFAGPPATTTEPVAVLLPPRPIETAPRESTPAEVAAQPSAPALGGPNEQERLLVEQVIRDCSESTTGVLSNERLDEMAANKIRHANALANRGAHYAARRKLIETLRMISQAKDVRQGNRQFSSALAAGLRALEEAEDFAPRGTQLEGELDLSLITAAHRTPIAQQSDSSTTLPQEMMDRYFRYAQLKLAKSVAGQPAGSMALYALGKVTSQMGRLEPLRHRLAHRRAVTFQQAALLSHNQNHLAAHELAVLLAESGHFPEAEELLLKVSTHQPNPTVYANLAHVQRRMGLTEQATVGQALAAQLAQQGAGRASPVQWIAPEEFNRTRGESVQVSPRPGSGAVPMTRRPRYDQRTASAPSTTAPSTPAAPSKVTSRPVGPIPSPDWR